MVGCVAAITVSCGNKNQTKIDPPVSSELTSGIDAFVGSYVSDGYSKKEEGYDWVAVTIKKLSDSTAQVSIRSRADKKKPSCTFDMDVTKLDSVTLNGRNEGYSILFKLNKNVLSNIKVEKYFSLSSDKKSAIQYLVLKLVNKSVKLKSNMSDEELREFINVLQKKNVELENYEFAEVLKDIVLNFDIRGMKWKIASLRCIQRVSQGISF